jgi:hypothetical protein
MKRIMLISALAAILSMQSVNGWAQEYPTMLDGNPKWICLASEVDGHPTFKTFYLDGDTIINGLSYRNLYYEWNYKDGQSVLGHPVKIAAIREYEGKVLAAKSFYKEMYMDLGNYYEAFEELENEVVVYDWNVLREGKSIKVFQDGNTTEREIVERTTTEMADGSQRALYKVFNHDPENLKKGQQAYVEIIDQVGCINMPKELVHYLWEPKNISYSSSSSKVIVGTTMDFIQNNTIVYRAPMNAYVSYDFITDLVPTGIEAPLRLPLYGERNNTAYNLQGQRINTLQKGLNIVNGKKIYVK